MKLLKYLLLGLLISLGTEMWAQGPGGRGRRGMGPNMDSLKVKLSLTDDQVEEMKAIQEDMRSKRRAVFESSEGDREAMREEMMKLQSSADEQVKGILTVEQWDKYEAYREEEWVFY
ncbi:Spy/CpxP family protein refolding chaperone [Okeania hirsuta]|uniref:Spy/CpxP family protein refolding chaperone n=1 Tax=Okeania hirsuta TaxID=1458930 RepID=UPI000F540D34|nr:Spy/CpxP family protein refolding chaperone [Okeania hirsuta]RQH25791.1 hypothetical protein D4Z78_01970 [Okeania hirsuta]